jgi:hypothetical protein
MSEKIYDVIEEASGAWAVTCSGIPIIRFPTNKLAWAWLDRQRRNPLWVSSFPKTDLGTTWERYKTGSGPGERCGGKSQRGSRRSEV